MIVFSTLFMVVFFRQSIVDLMDVLEHRKHEAILFTFKQVLKMSARFKHQAVYQISTSAQLLRAQQLTQTLIQFTSLISFWVRAKLWIEDDPDVVLYFHLAVEFNTTKMRQSIATIVDDNTTTRSNYDKSKMETLIILLAANFARPSI